MEGIKLHRGVRGPGAYDKVKGDAFRIEACPVNGSLERSHIGERKRLICFSSWRFSYSSHSVYHSVCWSFRSSSFPRPLRFLSCQDRWEAFCRPKGISKYRQEGLVESGSMACGQEGTVTASG